MSEYRCTCGGLRHKCDIQRIAELERECKNRMTHIEKLSGMVDEMGEKLERLRNPTEDKLEECRIWLREWVGGEWTIEDAREVYSAMLTAGEGE